jgi:hypothetical protein
MLSLGIRKHAQEGRTVLGEKRGPLIATINDVVDQSTSLRSVGPSHAVIVRLVGYNVKEKEFGSSS